MDLTHLLHRVEILAVRGDLPGRCPALCYDSRACGPGAMFVAVPGLKTDGHAHIADAIARGARIVVHEAPWTPPPGVAALRVADTRRALGRLARAFYGDPSAALTLAAVTGTNGKTTVAYLLEAILAAAGHRVGVLGTVNYRYGNRTFPAPNTTPESCEFQRLLREMADAGVTHVVAEVSSHAVDLRRVDEVAFDIGVFTNLSRTTWTTTARWRPTTGPSSGSSRRSCPPAARAVPAPASSMRMTPGGGGSRARSPFRSCRSASRRARR